MLEGSTVDDVNVYCIDLLVFVVNVMLENLVERMYHACSARFLLLAAREDFHLKIMEQCLGEVSIGVLQYDRFRKPGSSES